MVISKTTIFARNEKCPVREIGNGLVIMAPTGDVTHSLEDLGAFIWNQLDGRQDLATVLRAVMEEYDVTYEVAEADLQVFVSELLGAEVILQVSE